MVCNKRDTYGDTAPVSLISDSLGDEAVLGLLAGKFSCE